MQSTVSSSVSSWSGTRSAPTRVIGRCSALSSPTTACSRPSAGGTYDGRAAIVSTLDYLDAHYPRSMHFVGNHQVELAGETAKGLVYCLAHHVYSRDGEDRDTLMVIRYQDEYRRTADEWRIARRALRIDWQEDRPLTVNSG